MRQQDALVLVEECLKELESPKGSVSVAMGKLYRISSLLNINELKIWCLSYQGNALLTDAIRDYINCLLELQEHKGDESYDKEKGRKNLENALKACHSLGIIDKHLSSEELTIRYPYPEASQSIEFLETTKRELDAKKQGNNGTYYSNDLAKFISFIKNKIQLYATELYEQLRYSGTVSNCFDLLKNDIDDKLLDLNPELAEQLMATFKSVNTDDAEQWSHALTSCRRLLEGLADELFPATKELVKGRELKQNQYINRLWAFMDKAIESESNRDLAKAHVDYLGGWLQRSYKVANKGVHAEISQLEATKLVFHIYLVLADILEYLDHNVSTQKMLNLHDASLDEMEALASISRDIAKEIVKLRVKNAPLTDAKLLTLKGLGRKTLEKIKENFTY